MLTRRLAAFTVAAAFLLMLPSGHAHMLWSDHVEANIVTDPSGMGPVAAATAGVLPESIGLAADAPAWRQVLAAPEGYELTFTCPATDSGYQPSTNAQTVTLSCPFRVIDDQDLLGSPRIAIRPGSTEEVAFFSLHGQAAPGGPSDRSRDPVDTGTHTTFTTYDQGISWTDNPINHHFPAGGSLGEAAAGAMDADGHIYIAYLWSHPGTGGGWAYTVGLYKQDTVEQPIRYVGGHHIRADAGFVVDDVYMARIPGEFEERDYSNDTSGSGIDHEVATGNDTDDGSQRIMANWFQRGPDGSGFIDAAWTDTSARGGWTHLNTTQRIGPCSAGSNVVGFNSEAYVACVVAPGYEGRDRARVGDVDIWRIDPEANEAHFHNAAPFLGGQPLLAVAPNGRMAYAGYEYLDQSRIRVETGFGYYGRAWAKAGDIGPALHGLAGNVPAVDARVTGLALSEDSGSIFLSYMERSAGPTIAPGLDPANPVPGTQGLTEYRKLISTMNECDGFLAAFDLQAGQSSIHFPNAEVGNGAVFNDQADGLAMTRDPVTGQELLLFAFGDYGVVQYGGLYETAPPPCPTFPPALFPGAPAIPQALTVAQPAATVVGAAFGVVSVAMVAYLLTVKRRSAVAAVAEDR